MESNLFECEARILIVDDVPFMRHLLRGFMQEQNSNTGRKIAPFIMVTANNRKEYVTKAINLGVAEYIVKPFTLESVLKKIDNCLRLMQTGEQLKP